MSDRWPLHPTPGPYDLLRQWIRRIANSYDISYEVFCLRVLNLERAEADQLSFNPPDETLKILAKGTGQSIAHLREMTVAMRMLRATEELNKALAEDPGLVDRLFPPKKKPSDPENADGRL